MSLRVRINILITLLMLDFIGSTTAIQLRDAKQQIQEEITAHEERMFNSIGDLIYDSPPSKYKAGRNAPKWFSNLVSP